MTFWQWLNAARQVVRQRSAMNQAEKTCPGGQKRSYYSQTAMRRFFTLLALATLLILALLYGLACFYGPKIVFYGAHFGNTRGETLADSAPGMQPTQFTTADGTVLRGWLLNRGQGAPLVVAYGGNNMNVGDFAGLAELAPHSSLLLLNHRGYGASEGRPTEERVVDDARRALRHYHQQLGEPKRVTLLGFSLGTGVATQVAASEKVSQLILACPFDSVLATGCQHVPLLPRLIPLDSFRSDLAAPQVRCPVSIFMGTQDTIVPNERTLSLLPCFRHTQVQLHRIPCGHNDMLFHPETLALLQELFLKSS